MLVLVRQFGRALASIVCMFVVGVLVEMSVDGAVVVTVFVLVLHVLVGVRVDHAVRMLMLMDVSGLCHLICIHCRQIESYRLRPLPKRLQARRVPLFAKAGGRATRSAAIQSLRCSTYSGPNVSVKHWT